MNVIYIVSCLSPSGPTQQLYNIVSRLDLDIFNPTIITLSNSKKNLKKPQFTSLGIRVVELNLSLVKFILYGRKKINLHISFNNPDVIHTSGLRPDLLLSFCKITAPWILTVRNYPFDDYPSKFGKKGWIFAFLHLISFRKCPNVIACSKSIKQKLSKHKINSYVIRNGVEPFSSSKVPDIITKLKGPIFIYTGSLIPRKNVTFLVNGFNEYKNNNGNGNLLILGDGVEITSIKKIAQDSIKILGNVDNVGDHINNSDIFVSCSLSEGFPNSVLEALSSNLISVLSNIPAHREVYELSKKSCLLFNLYDKHALITKLNAASNLIINKTYDNINQSIFSAKKMSSKYQKLYKSLVD